MDHQSADNQGLLDPFCGRESERSSYKRSFVESEDTPDNCSRGGPHALTGKRHKADDDERYTKGLAPPMVSSSCNSPYPWGNASPTCLALPSPGGDEFEGASYQNSESEDLALESAGGVDNEPGLRYCSPRSGIEEPEWNSVGHPRVDGDGDITMSEAGVKDGREFCFGMISDSTITCSRPDMHHRLLKSHTKSGKKGKKSNKGLPLVIRPRLQLVTVHLSCGEYIGLLDKLSSNGIQQLLKFPSIRFQALIPPPDADTADEISQSQEVQTTISIFINIYGPSDIGDVVGKTLSKMEIYLQHPEYNEKKIQYQNPQYFTRQKYSEVNSASLRPARDAEESIRSLFKQSVNTSLPTMEFGNEIRTTLLNHQKQAVYFMLDKEKTVAFEEEGGSQNPIWKVVGAGSGCVRYINKITNKISLDRPQSAYGGILADEMGLGKSLTTLALITSTREQARLYATGLHTSFDNSIVRDMYTKPRLYAKSTLMVVPASLMDSWKEQVDLHISPGVLKVYTYHGAHTQVEPEILASFDIVITTYSTIRLEFFPQKNSRPRKYPLRDINWFRVVLDEAHIIREPSTQQSEAICQLHAQRRWCLTGTPIQNKLEDFGTLLRFLRLSPFDQKAQFNHHIIKPLRMGSHDGIGRLRLLIGLTCLRRNNTILDLPPRTVQTQYINFLPADRNLYEACKIDSKRLIEHALSGNSHAPTYFGILQSILKLRLICNHGKELLSAEVNNRLEEHPHVAFNSLIDSGMENLNILQEPPISCNLCSGVIDPIEMRQQPQTEAHNGVCNSCSSFYAPGDTQSEAFRVISPIPNDDREHTLDEVTQPVLKWMEGIDYGGPSTKVMALLENLRGAELEGGNMPIKSVIFSCWTKMLDLIALALTREGMQFARVDGSHTIQQRTRSINKFREDSQTKILLISIGCGGVGLNLTVASRVHLMEPQWNPMVEEQALGRIYRIGQTREVIATRYIVKNTIEASILDFQRRKLALASLSLSPDNSTGGGENERMKMIQAIFK